MHFKVWKFQKLATALTHYSENSMKSRKINLFFQKFRESNVLTKEITKVNLTEETFGKHFCILGCFSMHGTKILSNQLFSNTVWKSKVKRDHAQKFSVKIHT